MKTPQERFNSKVPVVTIDPLLNKYQDKTLFPAQLAKANEMLKAAKLPKKNRQR